MRPVLFTQRVEVVELYNERRDCADQRITEFISECGFVAVPVPNRAEIVRELYRAINPAGIILTGGNSLQKYGGNAPERDKVDRALIEMSVERHTPLYGFCRGMQSILDYFGNDLVQVSGHVAVRHEIQGLEKTIQVNSYHNQGCLELVFGELVAVMKSDDGVIEKIKHKSLPIIGTMWHPERENPFRDSDMEIVKKLIGGIGQ